MSKFLVPFSPYEMRGNAPTKPERRTSMTAQEEHDIAVVLAGQRDAREYLVTHPEGPHRKGAILGLSDYLMEEVLILTSGES